MFTSESGYVGPVGFAGAVDDGASQGKLGKVGKDLRAMGREPRIVQVIVGIEEWSHGRSFRGADADQVEGQFCPGRVAGAGGVA